MNKIPPTSITKWLDLALLSLALFFLTSFLMLPSNPMDNLPGRDNGVFLYGGQQVLQGKIPYADFWDHKGPLIFYINALGLLAGGGLRWGVWGTEFLFLFFTGGVIFLTARNQWGHSIALVSLAAWGYGMFVGGPYGHFRDSNYTETYSLLFSVFSVYLWGKSLRFSSRDWVYISIGVLAGLSFLLRPNNIGMQFSIGIVEVARGLSSGTFKASVKKILLLAVGGLSVLLACILYFFSRNALPELIDSVIVYNMSYRLSGISSVWEIIGKGFSIYGWLPLVLWLMVLISFFRRDVIEKQIGSDNGLFAGLLLVALVVEAFVSSMSGRILLHYYITWIPCLSWLAGGAVFAFAGGALEKIERLPAGLLSGAALMLLLIFNTSSLEQGVDISRRLFASDNANIEKQSLIGHYTADQTQPGDTVLVWGNDLWINFEADRASPSRYGYQYPLFMKGYTDRGKVMAFLSDLRDSPPSLIVEPTVDTSEIVPLGLQRRSEVIRFRRLPDGMEAVFDFVDRNYCILIEFRDITIYRFSAGGAQLPPCR